MLSGSGVEISEDENATIFSFNIKTALAKEVTKNISYIQQIPDCSYYDGKIDIYRQPGLRNLITP